MSPTAVDDPPREAALRSSAAALRRAAGYRLPPELDRRILDLGERKEMLSPEDRDELLAWVAFAQERSLEKFGSELALRRLTEAFPEIDDRP